MKVAILLYKSPKRDDEIYPLYIRITENRKPYYKKLEINRVSFNLHISQWLDGVVIKHPNSRFLNIEIPSLLSEANRYIMHNPGVSVESVFNIMLDKAPSDSFIEFYRERGRTMKSLFTRDDYERKVDMLLLYTHNKDILFKDITVRFLVNFQDWLRKTKAQNSVHNHLKTLRAVYMAGLAQDIVKIENSPFFKFKLERGKAKKKEKLSLEDIEKYEAAPLSYKSAPWHARNAFLFSVSCFGMRAFDLLTLKWENIKEGRLRYKMNKTGKERNILLSERALAILALYPKDTIYIFPYANPNPMTDKEFKKDIWNKTTSLNYGIRAGLKIAGVDKHISSHAARNSVANELRNKNVHISSISAALGHTNIKTTQIYLSELSDEGLDDISIDLYKKK